MLVLLLGCVLALARTAGAQDVTEGARVFETQCAMCHSLRVGRNMVGPSLAGIVGREAGIVPGFAYSPAMEQAGLRWTPTILDRYIADPRAVLPGTRMPYLGLQDATRRAALIAYLTDPKA